jgi:hypothetical protein
MIDALARIESSLAKNPRNIRLAYFNPIHEEVFRSCGWLKFNGHRSVPGFKRARVSLWSNDI